jgi:hypothetical protein
MAINLPKIVRNSTKETAGISQVPVHSKPLKPKILLIDTSPETESLLKSDWSSVASGTFGPIYPCPRRENKSLPAIQASSLPPDRSEAEIVAIDLTNVSLKAYPVFEDMAAFGSNDFWASCASGRIDARPLAMSLVHTDFDRIVTHGGVFFVFAHPRRESRYVREYKPFVLDDYAFLGYLDSERVSIASDRGREIVVASVSEPLIGFSNIFDRHVRGAEFFCSMQREWKLERQLFTPLATNKFGHTVAAALGPFSSGGWVFLLPGLASREKFLADLLKNVLPELCPHLFPESEGKRWVQRPDYELTSVAELRRKIEFVQSEAAHETVELEKRIEAEREELGYMHDLLTQTGRPLVLAVKRAFEAVGFQEVVDVDEQNAKESVQGSQQSAKREDLRVLDRSPALIIEVEGISGLPSEKDALQVTKYLIPRMREWNRTDVQGLSIVNHQRNLPALDRDNVNVFQTDVLTNAQHQGFGLLTTFDLYRLVRSYQRNGWDGRHVRDIFYKIGHIEPVPSNYEYVGTVEHFYPKVAAVVVGIEGSDISVGERVSFELPVEYVEQAVTSLEVDHQPVQCARAGQSAGISTELSKAELREGTRVFRIKSN